MRVGCSGVLCLFPILASLWRMTQCLPRAPRPVCYEETTLAQKTSRLLTRSLHTLKHSFQRENIIGNEKGVCVPEESNSVEWSIDLDTVAHRLCQYQVCFQRVGKALDSITGFESLNDDLTKANIYLDNLLTAFEKMKWPYDLPRCKAAHFQTETLWLEISNGHRLAQNLLSDLGHLSIHSLCQ